MSGKLTGKTKLGQRSHPGEKKATRSPVKITGVGPKRNKIKAVSYRLTNEDKARLKSLVEAVGELEPNKTISETYVVRAVIGYCSQISPEKLLKAARRIGL